MVGSVEVVVLIVDGASVATGSSSVVLVVARIVVVVRRVVVVSSGFVVVVSMRRVVFVGVADDSAVTALTVVVVAIDGPVTESRAVVTVGNTAAGFVDDVVLVVGPALSCSPGFVVPVRGTFTGTTTFGALVGVDSSAVVVAATADGTDSAD